MRRAPTVHLVLLSAFPTLYLFAKNRGEIFWSDLPGPLMVCVGSTLAVWLLLRSLPGRPDGKAAGLALVVMALFAYGHAKRVLQKVADVETEYVLAAAILVLGLGLTMLLGRRVEAWGLTSKLNLFAACLVAIPIAQILLHRPPEAIRHLRQLAPEGWPSGHRHPNIFYVIVDGYSRDDVLREVLGFDNGAFLAFLSDRGFVVPALSRSNYGQTDRSIASSLNMRLLAPGDPAPAVLIETNEVFSVLRRHRYRCLAFSTGYRATEIEGADAVLGSPDQGWSELESVLFAMTPLPDTIRALHSPNPFRAFDEDAQRARILYTLSQLPEVAADPGPLFVFAHIMAPHPPYVFGPEGQARERDEYVGLGDQAGWLPRHQEAYAAQLTFLNTRLRVALDGVLARSGQPPVVILQADHGSAFRLNVRGPDGAGALAERFAILNALLVPPGIPAHFYPGITPVNTFPILFGALFGGRAERQDDRSFWSFDGRHERDVTSLAEGTTDSADRSVIVQPLAAR